MAGYRAALAATTAADAPLNAEMLAALQSVGMDAVGVGGGENTISDSARAKVEAVLEKIGAPWPSSDTAAAAPVVLPEPVGWIDKSALEWIGSRDRGTDAYSTAYLHKSQCAEAGEPIYTEQQMRALLAGVSAPAAQAVWDGKLPESLQRALNELRIDCKTDAISSLEFEVRSVFEGMHTSLTTVKRMYHAAQKRLDSTDAAQPDPFAAPQAQADARDALDQSGWVSVEDALPEYSISEVLILQMYFEADGAARMHDKEDPALGYLYNIAKGHCHQDGPVPRWSGRSGDNFGLLFRGGWRVVAWRHIHPASNYVSHIAAIAAAKGE